MASDFYRMECSDDPKIVGVTDGLNQAEMVRSKFEHKSNYDDFENYFFDDTNDDRYRNFPPQDVNLEFVRLRRQAKLTDFLYFAPVIPQRLLVSDKAVSILKQFNLPVHKFYPARVFSVKNDFLASYHLFYYFLCGWDVIDFNRSIFISPENPLQRIPIASVDDLDVYDEWDLKKISVKSKEVNELDLFYLPILAYPIVSSRLKDTLEMGGTTGITFRRIDLEAQTAKSN